MKNPPRKLIEVIRDLAKAGPKTVYEVHLSTGKVVVGLLSALDEESDHIRVNPTGDVGHATYVALAHIVSLHASAQG